MINCFCRWADWAGGRLIPGLPAHPNEPFICFPRYLPQLHLSTSSRHRRRRRGSPPLLPSPPPPPPQKLGSSRRECLMAAASIPASSQPFKVRGPAAAPPIKLICSLFEELSLIWSVRLGDNGGGDCYTRCGSSQLILGHRRWPGSTSSPRWGSSSKSWWVAALFSRSAFSPLFGGIACFRECSLGDEMIFVVSDCRYRREEHQEGEPWRASDGSCGGQGAAFSSFVFFPISLDVFTASALASHSHRYSSKCVADSMSSAMYYYYLVQN